MMWGLFSYILELVSVITTIGDAHRLERRDSDVFKTKSAAEQYGSM